MRCKSIFDVDQGIQIWRLVEFLYYLVELIFLYGLTYIPKIFLLIFPELVVNPKSNHIRCSHKFEEQLPIKESRSDLLDGHIKHNLEGNQTLKQGVFLFWI